MRSEIKGIIYLILSIYILLSLMFPTQAYTGIIGEKIADALFYLLGKSSFILPIYLFYAALNVFKQKERKKLYLRIILLVFLLMMGSIFTELIFPGRGWSGENGKFFASLFKQGLGTIGSYIFVLAVFVISLLGVTDLSLKKFKKNLKKIDFKKSKISKKVSPQKTSPSRSAVITESKESVSSYKFPSLDLLNYYEIVDKKNQETEINQQAKVLQETLTNFGIKAQVCGIHCGPSFTRYDIKLVPGVKVGLIQNLANDISLALKSPRVRILAPIPGQAAVGIEVPNPNFNIVGLRELLDSEEFRKSSSLLSFVLGKTVSGQNYLADLETMPHLLIAGATGSGKSICINCIILSIIYKAKPEEVKFLLIDPKMVEFSVYNGIPHLITPVITDLQLIPRALKSAIKEMENRYQKFLQVGVRDINEYNRKFKSSPLPYLVIIIDELADLMVTSGAQIESCIIRLAQMSRAVGIHLILATQRPSVNVITGIIKANLPARIAFQVTSKVDSRTILDMNGAEDLLGRGDLLYLSPSAVKPIRLQGGYVSGEEIEKVVNFIKLQSSPQYVDNFLEQNESKETEFDDELYPQAVELVILRGQASISLLQRKLKIGYNRAACLIEEMMDKGIIGPQEGIKGHSVLVGRDYLKKFEKK